MSFVLAEPFQRPPTHPNFRDLRNHYVQDMRLKPPGMSGFFDDIGDFFTDGIEGLTDALGGAIAALGHALEQIGETIALIVRAAIGDVKWSEVLDSMGVIFQDIGAIMVYLDPTRGMYDWLSTSELTSHAFHELDKFTGGMLTTSKNVSTLVGRAMRGDPISKQELIADIIFIIQVCLIIFTAGAWVAVGVMIGTMVGREVCKHQTEARDACLVAFQIIGAAAGGYGQAWYAAQAGFSTAEEAAWLAGDEAYAQFLEEQAQAGAFSVAEENAFLEGDTAYAKFLEQEAAHTTAANSTSFLTQLSNASSNTLNTLGIDRATQELVKLCQNSNIVGNNECQILGQIAADYIKAPEGIAWADFLAGEIVKIGSDQLMLQWFPPDSPEHQAIRQVQIRYSDTAGENITVTNRKFDPKTLLLIAGGVAVALLGGAS